LNTRVVTTEIFITLINIIILIRFIGSTSPEEFIFNGLVLLGVIMFSFLLIRSVLHEVRQREEISKLAEDLRVANAELKKLDQMKSEFVSLASHQLRTPLTVIKGYISMIQEGSFGKVADPLSDALRKIYISNETLINLVGDFLNLSRIESGKMKYTFEPTQMEGIIQSVFEEFMEVVKEKKLELRYENPETPLAKAMLDKDKFKQVIMNLVDNAVKYTPEGSVTLKIEEEKEKGNVLFSVSDTGVGMSKGELDGIFKRFSRGESGSKVNTSGLGLGLYLAKRIVTDHGGEIWATSDGPGKGSTFWVRVPVHI
ncbi:MAG: PAS/PAC sensor signal transduction histidine kinase, partial [Candidatus Giovannonibacteria bacterium GW2011_GWA2_45_21]